jgi:hypothetical protein
MTAHTRLAHLLELADKGPALRAALAEEVAELLTAWPDDYPADMRGICETLLARAVRDVDGATRARLRVQLCADPELTARILPREAPSRSLIDAARSGEDVARHLAERLGVEEERALEILRDESCVALAVAAKAADLGRPVFSALAILTRSPVTRAQLDVYDTIGTSDAARQLRGWRDGVAA